MAQKVEPLLVGDVLRTAARRVPGRAAVTLGGRQLTFGQLAAQAERTAAALHQAGVRRGDRVAWWAENSLDAVGLYFGLAYLGGDLVDDLLAA